MFGACSCNVSVVDAGLDDAGLEGAGDSDLSIVVGAVPAVYCSVTISSSLFSDVGLLHGTKCFTFLLTTLSGV